MRKYTKIKKSMKIWLNINQINRLIIVYYGSGTYNIAYKFYLFLLTNQLIWLKNFPV